ncbi:MAG: type II secretion system protein [Glaciimonas sp.]|nr:type II secretion system protein [Glaciimonas sp.]
MKHKFKKSRGFTLIEITLVIIVMGILAAAIAPMLAGVVGRAQADAERSKLKVLKEALLADALEKGGFVDPLTNTIVLATNTPNTFAAAQPNQYLPASANALALGMPLTSAFNNPGGDNLAPNTVPAYSDLRPASFLYDVRNTLTRAAAGNSPLKFCTNAAAAMLTTADPYLCSRAAGHDTQVACQVTAVPPDLKVPVAMVLVSRGKNRQFEFENLEGFNASGTAAVAATTPPELPRTYESPNRGVNYSNDTGAYYDDAVESISLAEVVSACQKRGILAIAACPVGQRQLRLFNNNTVAPVSYKLDANACVPAGIPAGSEYPLGCISNSTLIVNSASDCTTGTPITNNLNLASDVNGDLTILVTCTAANCTTN